MIHSLVTLGVGIHNIVAHGAEALGVLLLRGIAFLDSDKYVIVALDTIVHGAKARIIVTTEVAGIEVTGPQHCSPRRRFSRH